MNNLHAIEKTDVRASAFRLLDSPRRAAAAPAADGAPRAAGATLRKLENARFRELVLEQRLQGNALAGAERARLMARLDQARAEAVALELELEATQG